MTEQLKAAMSRAEKLPQEQQDASAQMISDQLDEQEWDALIKGAKSQTALMHEVIVCKKFWW